MEKNRKKQWKRILLCLIMTWLMIATETTIGLATGTESWDWQKELDAYDFSELEQLVQEMLPEAGLSFRQVTEQLITGDVEAFGRVLWQYIKQQLWGQFCQEQTIAWQILLLAIAGALFANLARVFPEGYVSQNGFFVMYMVLAAVLLTVFSLAVTTAVDGLMAMGKLMSAFLPVFFLAVAVQGRLTAAAMYEFALLLLRGILWLYQYGVAGGVRIWVLLGIVEGIFSEETLTHLTELLGKGLRTVLKISFATAVGFQTVQALLLPYLDAVSGGMLVQLASAIPGVGNGIRSAAQMALGTAAFIRNAIGMAGVLLLVVASVGPLCQLGMMAVVYHGTASLLQPISDKRVVGAISAVGDGCFFLLKTFGMGILLFGIFIGIACACFGRVG